MHWTRDTAVADRPPVTVHEAARVELKLDVLGEEPTPVCRRWTAAAVVAALLLATAGAWVIEQRGRTALARRADGVADMSLTDRYGFHEALGPRVSSLASLMSLDVEVRNDGPRSVVVEGAVVGGFLFVGRATLVSGGTFVLPLVRTVTCPPDDAEPPLDPLTEGLRLQVTTHRGARSVVLSPGVLALDRLRIAARRACGFRPVEESVAVTADARPPVDSRVPVTLVLTNASALHLQLLDVQLPPGLQRADGAYVPTDLVDRPPGGSPSTTEVALWLAPDCGAARRTADGTLLPLPPDPVHLLVGEPRAVLRPVAGDLSQLQAAFARACS